MDICFTVVMSSRITLFEGHIISVSAVGRVIPLEGELMEGMQG